MTKTKSHPSILPYKSRRSGFTLVEIAVATSVLLLLCGVGASGALKFKRDRELRTVRSRLYVIDQAQTTWLKEHPGKGLQDARTTDIGQIVTSLEGTMRSSSDLTKLQNWDVNLLQRPAVAKSQDRSMPVVSIDIRRGLRN